MYVIFGVLIIGGFKALSGVSSFSGLWFFTLLGVIAIVMGLLNLKDAIWYGGGGVHNGSSSKMATKNEINN